jgi:hypothetical protein
MLDMNLAFAGLDFEDIFGGIIDLAKVLALKNDEVIEGERDNQFARSLEVFITPFYGEAAVAGILAVIHDITVQKKRRGDEAGIRSPTFLTNLRLL